VLIVDITADDASAALCMTNTKIVDHLFDRLIEKFERSYGIRLTPFARDCLTRDFKIEVEKLIDDAYAAGWCDSQAAPDGDEAGAPTP
jgi:hypothetical protein